MAKYRIFIPKASQKRLEANRKVMITCSVGFSNDERRYYDLSKDQNEFEFEVSDEFEWKHSAKTDNVFDVRVQYKNKKETYEEFKELVPDKI